MELSRAWSDVAGQGDVEATLDYWADDAVVIVPGQAPLRGIRAIREFVEGTTEIPGFAVSWEPLEAHVADSGDMAYLIEQNQFTMNDSTGTPVTERNTAVTVWERQADGSWKCVVDIWNADARP